MLTEEENFDILFSFIADVSGALHARRSTGKDDVYENMIR